MTESNRSEHPEIDFLCLRRNAIESLPSDIIDVETEEDEAEEPMPPHVPITHPSANARLPIGIPDDAANIRIAVWGAPRAGKTTYLSALRRAAQDPVDGNEWTISGRDDASTEFLITGVKRVLSNFEYPGPTTAVRLLAWKFQGMTHHERNTGWWARLRNWMLDSTRDADVEFILEVQDVPGEVYAGATEHQRHLLHDNVVERLLRAQGIVYLFDSVGAAEADTNSFDYYFETVERLRKRAVEQNLLVANGRLRHHVSVCVTKLDKAAVFDAAMAAEVVYRSSDDAVPQVPKEFAAELFNRLCGDTGSHFVAKQLANDFLPGRVKYFVTSASGFHLDGGVFDRADFTNDTEDGRRLRSVAAPINVLEPIISLHRRITHPVDGVE
ncbi:hypothetical protein [Nocardia crassostreae]|uniref:hypothetical protein n=1 Tax=Nocardia crassostreae TaxID=53428 RepID=UPI000837A8D0|nr:hypothetical protein [Nocardia crassostreae]